MRSSAVSGWHSAARPLLSDNGTAWLGTAALVRAPDPSTACAILTADRYAVIEIHHWTFGGRPS